jgi:hypothetical protein
MGRQHRLLPAIAAVTGLAWMVAVLLVAANPKGIDLAGDLAYDRANRAHTVALVFLVVTAILAYRAIRAGDLGGQRAARVLLVCAALMLAGNTVAFWGALVVGQRSEQFWGGWVGWLVYLSAEVVALGTFIVLARAARHWPTITRNQRWAIGSVGVFLSTTTATWAISAVVTLVPALVATFALLAAGTAIAQATEARLSARAADDRADRDARVGGMTKITLGEAGTRPLRRETEHRPGRGRCGTRESTR